VRDTARGAGYGVCAAFGVVGAFVKGGVIPRAWFRDLGMDELEHGEVVISGHQDCLTLHSELSLHIRLEASKFMLGLGMGGKLLGLAFRGEGGGHPCGELCGGLGQSGGLATEEFSLVQTLGISTGIFLGSVELGLMLSIKATDK